MTTTLVTGASGKVGRRVVEALDRRGVRVRSGSRGGEPPFDLADPSTWPATLDDVDRVFLLLPEGVPLDERLVGELGERALRVVLFSSRGIEEMGDDRLLDAERRVRERLDEWAIMRADWLNQNFDEGVFAGAVRDGALALPVGGARQGFVDCRDLGEVAATLLTDPARSGVTIEVTGPEALSFDDVARLLSEATGRPVTFDGTADGYRRLMASVGAPAEQIEAEIAAFGALRDAAGPAVTDAVEAVTGRTPIPFREFAATAAARGAWD